MNSRVLILVSLTCFVFFYLWRSIELLDLSDSDGVEVCLATSRSLNEPT